MMVKYVVQWACPSCHKHSDHLCAWLEVAVLLQSASFFSRQGNILVRLSEIASVKKGVQDWTMPMCCWQSRVLYVSSLGALSSCLQRREQNGGDNIDTAICPANMNGATLTRWVLDAAQRVLSSIISKATKISRSTSMEPWPPSVSRKRSSIKIKPLSCSCPRPDHAGVQTVEEVKHCCTELIAHLSLLALEGHKGNAVVFNKGAGW